MTNDFWKDAFLEMLLHLEWDVWVEGSYHLQNGPSVHEELIQLATLTEKRGYLDR